MLQKSEKCIGCPLYEKGIGFSQPEGLGTLGVMIVGEALGEWESREGLPFRPFAPAGSLLESVFRSCRYDRKQFSLWNTVACRPPHDWLENAPWEAGAIDHCRTHFKKVVEEKRPRVLLTLGNVALRALTGEAGKHRGIGYLRGYTFPVNIDGHQYLVHPSYHPSFLRRGAMNLKTVLSYDLMTAVKLAQRPPESFTRTPLEYQTRPSIDDAISFRNRVRDNPRQLLTYDIETPNSGEMPEDEREEDASFDLRSIQFSLAPMTGIFFPNDPAYMDIAREIMSYPNPKAGANIWNFDDPRLKFNKFSIGNEAESDDVMWMWHHMQPDLPAHLQFISSFFGMDFPWKHLSGSDEQFYGCGDVDSVQRIMLKLPDDLKKRGVWGETHGGYKHHIRGLHPILVDTSKRGLPVNNSAREQMRITLVEVRDGVHAEIQKLVPAGVRRLDPKKGYAKVPPRVKEMLDAGKTVEEISQVPFIQRKADGKEETFRFVIRARPEVEEAESLDLTDQSGEMKPVKVAKVLDANCWMKEFDFNPNSYKQVLQYMKAKKHPVPKNIKKQDAEGNAKETTDKDELERLGKKTNDSFYSLVIDFREHSKMIGTYVDGFAPAKDGCVHTTFTFRPAQGQLSSVGPNIQNVPKHQQDKPGRPSLAKAFRHMIAAHPGKKLIEIDLKAAHALTAGFEFRDLTYMRMARMDIHSYFGCHVLRLPEANQIAGWPDDQLRDFLKHIKKTYQHERDFKWKHALLGYGNGMGPGLLYNNYREDFESLAECKKLMDLLDHVFPVSAAARKAVREKAHREGYLLSRYGFIRWFTDVFHWDGKKRGIVPGDQFNQAVVFLFANDAHCHMKDAMLKMREMEMDVKYGFVNIVHDSFMFHCDDSLVDECIVNVSGILTAPNKVLTDPVSAPNGLEFGVSASVGKDWADMEEISIASLTKAAVQ